MRPRTCTIVEAFFVASQICRMLVVRPVQHADVEQCISIRLATLGSLVIGRPPPYPGYAEESEAAVHNDLDGKSHVKHLKVVDPEDESEVLAYAKWEIYPNGRPDLDKLAKPMDPADKLVDEYGDLREAAHEYFCKRNGHMGKYPHIRMFACQKQISRDVLTYFP